MDPSCPCNIGCCRGLGLLLAVACMAAAPGCTNVASQGRNAEGVRLFQTGRHQEALQQFHEATYADPGQPDGYYNIASTYHTLGKMGNRPEQLAQAETYYRRCLEIDPNHCDGHRGLAVLMTERGRKDEALRLVQNWAEREPRRADPKIELARLYEEFGNRAAAQERLAEAVSVEPNNPRQWAALGKLREQMGDYPQALDNYRRSLQLDNSQTAVAGRVAALQTALGQPPGVLTPTAPAQTAGGTAPAWR